MLPHRMMEMMEHGVRREQQLTDIVQVYQKALALIAQGMALHPDKIATHALREGLPIMEEMQNDPWPPKSAA